MASSNKKDIIFLDELCCICSLIDPKAPCPAKGPSAFPRDAEPYQSASKALFVAPRYSDFFLCFIHIFLRRLGVPHRLPPVSGREASAPGGRARSYSVVFLQRCLWLTNKTQGMYRVLLPSPSPLLMATSHSEPRVAWLQMCAHAWSSSGISKSGLSRGSVGPGTGMLWLPHLSLVPLFPHKGMSCKWDHSMCILSSDCHPTRGWGGRLPKERAGPFHQSPRDHAAVMSSTGWGEFTSLCMDCKDTVTKS